MSKLERHKEWLTITEAANYLSKKLDEDVTEADIFRLALKRRLVVSVYFVNHASARLCSIIPAEKLPIMSIKSPIDEDFRDRPGRLRAVP